MAISSLRRRSERLETKARGVGSFEMRIRRLAVGIELDPERLLEVTKGHEAELSPAIEDAGGITWPAFRQIYDLIVGAGPVLSEASKTTANTK